MPTCGRPSACSSTCSLGRWTPFGDEDRPLYSKEAARRRLADLREVAWRMVDPAEPVRFVADAFRFGGAAPVEMDPEIGIEAIRIWRELCVFDVTAVDLDEDGVEWDDFDAENRDDDLDGEWDDVDDEGHDA